MIDLQRNKNEDFEVVVFGELPLWWYCSGAMNSAFNAYNFKNWLDIFLGVLAEIRSSLQPPPLSKGEALLQ